MLSCPARPSSLPVAVTRQRDRPCTRAVYPQHLRDSALVQTAFAPSLASKYRSTPIVSSAPKRSPTSAALHRQKVYLRERQLPGVKSLQPTGGRIMRHPRRIAPALVLLLIVLAFQPVALRADTLSAAPRDQLGKVNFPTSCVADVQSTIEKGVALLHSFQYKESEQTFTEAAKRDPKCAIAHWGRAMARFYQIWEFPNDKKLKEGRKKIDQARKIKSTSPREKGFIAAAAAFFQKKSKMTH